MISNFLYADVIERAEQKERGQVGQMSVNVKTFVQISNDIFK